MVKKPWTFFIIIVVSPISFWAFEFTPSFIHCSVSSFSCFFSCFFFLAVNFFAINSVWVLSGFWVFLDLPYLLVAIVTIAWLFKLLSDTSVLLLGGFFLFYLSFSISLFLFLSQILISAFLLYTGKHQSMHAHIIPFYRWKFKVERIAWMFKTYSIKWSIKFTDKKNQSKLISKTNLIERVWKRLFGKNHRFIAFFRTLNFHFSIFTHKRGVLFRISQGAND